MKIALLGFGTVGYGVYEILKEVENVEIKYVLDIRTHEDIEPISTTDFNDILNDSEVETVVEVIGREIPAYNYIKSALESGKNVITANKLIICKHYKELTTLAKENKVALRYTAAAGGGIPWFVFLERLIRTDTVKRICAIINGTTNYILDSMHTSGAFFEDSLKEAQALGFAEADPSSDIDGLDTLRKIVLSANIAFGVDIKDKEFSLIGIRNIDKCDIDYATGNGYVCKLMAFAERQGEKISVFVEPVFVSKNSQFASVKLNLNRICVISKFAGTSSLFGYGAGRYPTANTVANDCIDVAFGVRKPYNEEMKETELDNDFVLRNYYVRTNAEIDGYTKNKDNVYLINNISVEKMHKLYKELSAKDEKTFVASFSGVD